MYTVGIHIFSHIPYLKTDYLKKNKKIIFIEKKRLLEFIFILKHLELIDEKD